MEEGMVDQTVGGSSQTAGLVNLFQNFGSLQQSKMSTNWKGVKKSTFNLFLTNTKSPFVAMHF